MHQARLRIWFGGLRIRLAKGREQETKYQLGLRCVLPLHR